MHLLNHPNKTSRALSNSTLVALALLLASCAVKSKPSVTMSMPSPDTAAPAAPLHPPSIIYVTDFYLSPGMIQAAPSIIGAAGGPVSRLREEAQIIRGDDPQSKAKKLVEILGTTITQQLNDSGIRAEYRPHANGLRQEFFPSSAVLPTEGWMLGGWFDRVQEPNRQEEAVVGFGAGSGKISVEVVVSDLAGNPHEPFLCIGSENAKNHMPGGIVAMNPYAMAAKFVLTRGQTDRQTKAMGKAIADSLIQFIRERAQPQSK